MLVHLLGFLALTSGDTLKVNLRINLDDFTANQERSIGILQELGHYPGLFAVALEAATQDFVGRVGRHRELLLFLGFFLRLFVFEHDAEKETQDATGVFQVGVKERVE